MMGRPLPGTCTAPHGTASEMMSLEPVAHPVGPRVYTIGRVVKDLDPLFSKMTLLRSGDDPHRGAFNRTLAEFTGDRETFPPGRQDVGHAQG